MDTHVDRGNRKKIEVLVYIGKLRRCKGEAQNNIDVKESYPTPLKQISLEES